MRRYIQKISGPLLDRIDLHITVQPVEYDTLRAKQGGEDSAAVRQRVLLARAYAQARAGQGAIPNAYLQGKVLQQACQLQPEAETALKDAFERLGLSARGYDRVLRVARTIADLEQSPQIKTMHISEAVQYRNSEQVRYNQ